MSNIARDIKDESLKKNVLNLKSNKSYRDLNDVIWKENKSISSIDDFALLAFSEFYNYKVSSDATK